MKVSYSQRSTRLFLLLFFIVTLVFPLSSMFVKIAETNVTTVFSSPIFISATLNSILSTLTATVISVVCALITAWILLRSKVKFKKIFIVLLTIPMLIPSISHGTGLVVLLGGNGILTNLLGLNFNIYGFTGVVLGSVLYSFPVALLMIYDILKYEDSLVYTSANILGIPKVSQLLKITIPYLRKPMIAVFFAVFTLIFTDYGVPLMVGGKFMTLPLYMYNEVIGLLDFGKGAAIGLVLIIPAFVAFILDIMSKENKVITFGNDNYQILKNKVRDIFAWMWSLSISVVVLLPIVMFVFLTFIKKYPINIEFSMMHILRTLDMGMVKYLSNSLIIALLTAFIGTLVSYLIAYFTSRSQGKTVKVLHLISMISLAIPGIVLGLSYILFFKTSFIYGTIAILVMVNIIHFFSSPYLMAYNALGKLNGNFEAVAKTLGIRTHRLIVDVLVPQTFGTLAEMFSYFFVNAMVTISAISFLTSINTQPLALMIPNLESMMMIESISFVSVIILIVNLILKGFIYLAKRAQEYMINKGREFNMELSRKEFDVLTLLEKTEDNFTQREIAKACNISVGTVNGTLSDLSDKGLIDENNKITEKGLESLEPYRVKRAVFIAAGFGSRLVPLTINSPKPLIRVNGVRMIDTLLDAVVAAGIEEIIIVRGYLKEQFDQLLYKYPSIKFIDNPYFNEANNISSALCARKLLQNAYVLEADLVLYNPELITKYQYTSNYLGVKTDMTDDWCFQTKAGIITKVLVGGRNVHHMYGISYWNEKDGAQLEEDIKNTFELPGGKERYWDQVSLEYFKQNYRIEVRECTFDDIIEIDSYADLKKIDPHYE